MALNLYAIPEETHGFTSLAPFTVTFDGRRGGAIDRKVYLRNDHLRRWYSNISLEAIDLSTERLSMVTEGVPGFFWKLATSDRPLFPEEWDLVTKGNTLSLSSDIGSATLGDITTYIPIWIRVQVPQYLAIATIKEITIRIIAKENYVNG